LPSWIRIHFGSETLKLQYVPNFSRRNPNHKSRNHSEVEEPQPCLELIDELVDDLPEPLVGQLQVDWRVRREDVVEDLAVVVVGLEPLVNGGTPGHPGTQDWWLKVLTNEKRGGLTMVSFDRSGFKLFSL
jgi:hypothetical protein